MSAPASDIEARVKVVLDGLKDLTGFRDEVAGLGVDSGKAATAAQKLDDAMQGLLGVSEQIEAYKALSGRLTETSSSLDNARERQRELTTAVAASLGPSQEQLRERDKANAAVTRLTAQIEKARTTQAGLTQQVIAAENPSAKLLQRHEETTRRLDALSRSLEVARDRQTKATAAVAAGSEPSARLAREHDAATVSVDTLTAQLQQERSELDRTGRALADAGVRVGELDKASARIRETFATVTAEAKRFADAQSKLNFIPHAQLQREAQDLRSSYDVLRSSGKLTAAELAQANLKLQEGLLDLERRSNGWKDSLLKARVEIGSALAAFAPIAYSIKQAVDFESALAGVRKVVDGTDEQFAALTDRVRQLSHELPISAEGLADIAAAGGQLGVPIEKLDQFIQLAAKVSVAFGISADQAGQAIAKLANVFGIPIENVEALGDAINVLGNTTAANEAQILDFLTKVGGSAKTFGLTAQATSALGATLISFGKAPEVAANAVNALLTRLQAANVQSPQVQQALAGIGLSATDLAQRIQADPQAALDLFLQTLAQLDGRSRTEALAEILGTEYSDDISLLVNNLGQYQTALAKATDAQAVAGAMAGEAAKQNETTTAQYQVLKNVLADIVRELGTAFLPTVKAAIVAGKSVAEAISDIVEAAPGLTAIVATVVTFSAAMSGLRIAAAATRVALTTMTAGLATTSAGLQATAASATTAEVATSRFGAALSALFKLAGAGIAGEAIGKYLYDQFEKVRRAGLVLTQSLVLGAEQVRYGWEQAKAIFTDDTLDAAEQRHLDRLAEIDAALQSQSDYAKQAGYDLRESADGAAAAQEGLASAATSAAYAVDGTSTSVAGLASAASDARIIIGSVSEAAQALGVDLGELSEDATVAGATAAKAMEMLLESGKLTSDGLRLALGKAIDSAKTVQDLDLIKAGIERAFAAGRLSADAYRSAVDRVTRAQTDLARSLELIPEQTQRIEALFARMGLNASSELDRIAEATKRDYDQSVKLGAALGDQALAFERYARAALDAAQRRGTYAVQEAALQLRAQAATDSQRKIVEQLTSQYAELGNTATTATAGAAAGHREASQRAAEEFDTVVDLINARARLGEADQQRIRDLREQADLMREQNSLVNARDRANNLSDVSAAAASINGRGAVGFGQDGINNLREIEAEIERAVSAGRIAADALSETKIDSPDDIREALRQASQARGQAAALSTVTGSQASEARSLAADLERGAAALERAVERYQQAGLESGDATSVNPGTGLGQNQIVFQPNPTTPPQTPAPLQPTTQTVNLNISIAGSVPVPLQGSQQAVDQLLRLLEDAGFNATLGP
jgi:TP901 family phage tail tape measure protein